MQFNSDVFGSILELLLFQKLEKVMLFLFYLYSAVLFQAFELLSEDYLFEPLSGESYSRDEGK